MHFLIHQNQDLTEVSGFMFTGVREALRDAELRMGVKVKAVEAYLTSLGGRGGHIFTFHVAVPVDGSTGLCREGQMTIIAQLDDVTDIAMRLCRRNGPIYGDGVVNFGRPPMDEDESADES